MGPTRTQGGSTRAWPTGAQRGPQIVKNTMQNTPYGFPQLAFACCVALYSFGFPQLASACCRAQLVTHDCYII